MKKALFITLLAIALTISIGADPIIVATSPWPPYTDETLANGGFTNDVIATVYKTIGKEANIVIDGWTNCIEKGAIGEYDMVFNGSQTEERAKIFGFSEPYTMMQIYLITRKGRNITYTSMEDLKPYKICAVDGYNNSQQYEDADYLDKVAVPQDIDAMKMLINNQVDLVILDKFVATYLLKNNPTLNAGLEDIDFIEPPLLTASIHAMFSKASENFVQNLSEFNQGLIKMKEDGTYLKILQKHGFDKF